MINFNTEGAPDNELLKKLAIHAAKKNTDTALLVDVLASATLRLQVIEAKLDTLLTEAGA